MSDEDTQLNGKPGRKPRTLYTPAQRAEHVRAYDAAPSKGDYKREHGIHANQILRWRSEIASKGAGVEPAPRAKPGRKPRVEAPRVVTAKEVVEYFQALEKRVGALERFELRFAKLLGGK